jgi:hypothetical protein
LEIDVEQAHVVSLRVQDIPCGFTDKLAKRLHAGIVKELPRHVNWVNLIKNLPFGLNVFNRFRANGSGGFQKIRFLDRVNGSGKIVEGFKLRSGGRNRGRLAPLRFKFHKISALNE